jgi:hypothetical protein
VTRIQRKQWDFLADVFISNAISGALQHSGTYVKTNSKEEERWLDKGKEKLQRTVKATLCELVAMYSTEVPVTTEQHMNNLKELIVRAEKCSSEFLRDRKLRIGVAAKMLNLFLKYLWCMGKIKVPPPHCAFDRQLIQDRLGLKNDDWTKISDPEVYLKWMEKAENIRTQENQKLPEEEKRNSLIEWELYAWGASTTGCPDTV